MTPTPATLTVWSLCQRLLHWTLAATVIASFATHERAGELHHWLGYAALACATLRIISGFALGGYWRFSKCVRGLGATWAYARSLLQRTEKRYIGHNPLGSWMVVALLANTLVAGVTGWMSITDRFWGVAWVADMHEASGEAFVPLVLLHLAGSVYTSWRHRENLIASMLHGRKAVTQGDV